MSKWITTTAMDESRHYISNSTIVMNDTAYVFGGSPDIMSDECANTVTWTRPRMDGTLEPWRHSKPFPEAGLLGTAAFSTPGYLHLTGGLDPQEVVSDRVWSVPVMADGSLGDWVPGPRLPSPVWYHCAAVVGARAYIWGGLADNDTKGIRPLKQICSAAVQSSGQLGEWRTENVELPYGIYDACSAVVGPYMFTICPRGDGAKMSSDIWWTFVAPSGVQPWRRQETQLPTRAYKASATDYRRGLIYVSGGKSDYGVDPQPYNFFIKLSPDARQYAEQMWVAQTVRPNPQATDNSIAEIEFARTGASTLSFQSEEGGPGRLRGFLDLMSAHQTSSSQRRPLVMYFGIDSAVPCQEQMKVIGSRDFTPLLNQAVFASINPRQYPQLAQQYAVYRVPTWIFYDVTGREKTRATGVQSAEELSTSLLTVK